MSKLKDCLGLLLLLAAVAVVCAQFVECLDWYAIQAQQHSCVAEEQ